MQRSFNDVLLELLVIIKYPNHKRQKFVKEFEELNHGEALANLLDRLPGEIKMKLKAKGVTPEDITQYIAPEKFTAEVMNVSSQALINFVSVVAPLLTLEQKEKVSTLLQRH